jgi:hypothetical protein
MSGVARTSAEHVSDPVAALEPVGEARQPPGFPDGELAR